MMSPPLPYVKVTENKNNVSFQMFKDLIYKNADPFKRSLVQWDKETYRDTFLNLLSETKKLSKLSCALKSYDEKEKLCFVQPEFNDHQRLRCYFRPSYVVVEINPNPTTSSSKWIHIVENYGADEDETDTKYEDLLIMQDLSEKIWQIVTKGVEMCVETVEQYLFALVNKQQPVYEQMKLIRIGEKSEEELKKEAEAWAKIHVLKKEKELNILTKMEKRKKFWNNIFGIKEKIRFS